MFSQGQCLVNGRLVDGSRTRSPNRRHPSRCLSRHRPKFGHAFRLGGWVASGPHVPMEAGAPEFLRGWTCIFAPWDGDGYNIHRTAFKLGPGGTNFDRRQFKPDMSQAVKLGADLALIRGVVGFARNRPTLPPRELAGFDIEHGRSRPRSFRFRPRFARASLQGCRLRPDLAEIAPERNSSICSVGVTC